MAAPDRFNRAALLEQGWADTSPDLMRALLGTVSKLRQGSYFAEMLASVLDALAGGSWLPWLWQPLGKRGAQPR